MIRIFLHLIAILMTLLFLVNAPMALMFPLWVFVYLYKDRISSIFKGKSSKFILAVLFFGLTAEVFAIIQNLPQTAEIRGVRLFHPDPVPDLIFAFFYYLVIGFVWYYVLKKKDFSEKSVLAIAGLFGVFVEQAGAALAAISAGPTGILIAIFVFFVHGLYPMLAYYVTKYNFPKHRKPPGLKDHLLTFVLMFASIIIYAPISLGLRAVFGGR